MAARLGWVLYYFFAGLAMLVFVPFFIDNLLKHLRGDIFNDQLIAILSILSLVLYAIGGACRYVLAGE